MFHQPLYSEEPSGTSSVVKAQTQLWTVKVAQCVQRQVSGEPRRVQVQGGEGVLHYSGVQPGQPLGTGYVTRVVKLIVRKVERIFLAQER